MTTTTKQLTNTYYLVEEAHQHHNIISLFTLETIIKSTTKQLNHYRNIPLTTNQMRIFQNISHINQALELMALSKAYHITYTTEYSNIDGSPYYNGTLFHKTTKVCDFYQHPVEGGYYPQPCNDELLYLSFINQLPNHDEITSFHKQIHDFIQTGNDLDNPF